MKIRVMGLGLVVRLILLFPLLLVLPLGQVKAIDIFRIALPLSPYPDTAAARQALSVVVLRAKSQVVLNMFLLI